MHWAAAVNNVEATLVLLKNGANKDMQNNKVRGGGGAAFLGVGLWRPGASRGGQWGWWRRQGRAGAGAAASEREPAGTPGGTEVFRSAGFSLGEGGRPPFAGSSGCVCVWWDPRPVLPLEQQP